MIEQYRVIEIQWYMELLYLKHFLHSPQTKRGVCIQDAWADMSDWPANGWEAHVAARLTSPLFRSLRCHHLR